MFKFLIQFARFLLVVAGAGNYLAEERIVIWVVLDFSRDIYLVELYELAVLSHVKARLKRLFLPENPFNSFGIRLVVVRARARPLALLLVSIEAFKVTVVVLFVSEFERHYFVFLLFACMALCIATAAARVENDLMALPLLEP